MDRCALFVDAGYLLADGAMAVHGTRRRDSVSWDYPGLLNLLAGLARDRSGLPVLRCYWYDPAADSYHKAGHDALADLPGLKLRQAAARPALRDGGETGIRADLVTLARNRAVSDAVVVSADESLAQVLAEVQDLGIRVIIVHVSADGSRTASRALRQECDDIIEVSGAHLRPFADLTPRAEAPHEEARPENGQYQGQDAGHGQDQASGGLIRQGAASGAGAAGSRPEAVAAAAIYPAPVAEQYQRTGEPAAAAAAGLYVPQSRQGSGPRSGEGPSGDADPPGAAQQPDDAVAEKPVGEPDRGGSQAHPAAAPHSASRAEGAGNGQRNGVSPNGYPHAGPAELPHRGLPGDGMPRSGTPAGEDYGPPDPAGAPPPYGAAPAQPPYAGPAAEPRYDGSAAAQGAYPGPAPQFPYGGQAQPVPYGETALGRSRYADPAPGPPGYGTEPAAGHGPAPQLAAGSLADSVQAAHAEGYAFGAAVASDSPALWLEAVLARRPRMPADLEARLLQGSVLPIDSLLHDEVRHALRRGFWDALERSRR